MVIRYSCKHCETEIGAIPFESAKETIQQLQKMDEKEEECFLKYEQDGSIHVRCICEHCEQSLKLFPDYYTLKKWLQ